MKSKEWSGEGISPIGTVCDRYYSEGDEWRKCEVAAYYLSNVVAVDVFDSAAVCLHFGLNLFQPIKTPNQTATEDQQYTFDEMIKIVGRYHI